MQRKARKHKGSSKVLNRHKARSLFCFVENGSSLTTTTRRPFHPSHGQPGISALQQNKGSVEAERPESRPVPGYGLHGPLAAPNFGGSRSDTVCSKKQPRTPSTAVKLLVETRLAWWFANLARRIVFWLVAGYNSAHTRSQWNSRIGRPQVSHSTCSAMHLPACRTTVRSEFRNKNNILHS
jgi:hypothetical protein